MGQSSLKAKNLKYLGIVLAGDICIIWLILFGDNLKFIETVDDWKTQILKNGAGLFLVSIIALLLSYLFSPRIKEILVFWRLKDCLPGCRAFSKYVYSDSRIDRDSLKKKLGSLPTKPEEQNALWYRLFKKHENEMSVQETHQRYLFFRDTASVSCVVILFLAIGAKFVVATTGRYWQAFVFTVGQYFLSMIAARNSANRFVQNVLALEGVTDKKIKKEKL